MTTKVIRIEEMLNAKNKKQFWMKTFTSGLRISGEDLQDNEKDTTEKT